MTATEVTKLWRRVHPNSGLCVTEFMAERWRKDYSDELIARVIPNVDGSGNPARVLRSLESALLRESCVPYTKKSPVVLTEEQCARFRAEFAAEDEAKRLAKVTAVHKPKLDQADTMGWLDNLYEAHIEHLEELTPSVRRTNTRLRD